jgi:hypothetical protein
MEVDIMSQDLKTWLKAIPPESEIDGRISEVESELELLRAIKQVRAHSPAAEQAARESEPESEDQNGALPADAEALRSRLSTERIRILRAILSHQNSRATIPDVVRALDDPDDRANIASNMQRMIKARLLSRVGRGRYALTTSAAQLIRSLDDDSAGDGRSDI